MSDQPIVAFANASAFRRWLVKHHTAHPGIWMQIAKKDSGIASVTYAEALDEALCFGWIDRQKKRFDETAWLQKFIRRAPRSPWSKINTGHIERLTREGRIQPAGQAAVDAAKADGRWAKAYDSSRSAEVPADFLAALDRHKKARAYFDTLNKWHRYAIIYRLNDAKRPETRQRRLMKFVAMMQRGEKLHYPFCPRCPREPVPFVVTMKAG
jgi:uncharacterized protein YdeI (YjbR/CyaY-like superfamily)